MNLHLIQRRIAEIRQARIDRGLSVRGLAVAAGVPPATIQNMDAVDWNPTANTLTALESALFAEGDQCPAA